MNFQGRTVSLDAVVCFLMFLCGSRVQEIKYLATCLSNVGHDVTTLRRMDGCFVWHSLVVTDLVGEKQLNLESQ